MLRCFSAFLDFCYLVRRSVINDSTLADIDDALLQFHQYRTIFQTSGARPEGFSLPRQHSLVHYRKLIEDFGAPNGLCSSITEAKHIKAVKQPWRRSSKFNALGQMLLTNQRLDKLGAAYATFKARGMLEGSVLDAAYASLDLSPGDDSDSDGLEDEDDEEQYEGGPVDGPWVLGEVKLARTPRKSSNFHLPFVSTEFFLKNAAIPGTLLPFLSSSVAHTSILATSFAGSFMINSTLQARTILKTFRSVTVLVSQVAKQFKFFTQLLPLFTHLATHQELVVCDVRPFGQHLHGAGKGSAVTVSLQLLMRVQKGSELWLPSESNSSFPFAIRAQTSLVHSLSGFLRRSVAQILILACGLYVLMPMRMDCETPLLFTSILYFVLHI
jgi:hypothetical protein